MVVYIYLMGVFGMRVKIEDKISWINASPSSFTCSSGRRPTIDSDA